MTQRLVEEAVETALVLGLVQLIAQAGGGVEAHPVPLTAGDDAQGGGDVGFA